MSVYILIFLLPLFFSLYSNKFDYKLKKLFWIFFGGILILLIGFRNEIGVDWEAYKRHYDITVNQPLLEVIFTSDIAYSSLNWFIALFSGKVYTVNFICSIVFVFGLIKFCRLQQSPGIAFIVSLPILILIVGMSYTRQGVAVGFEFLALLAIISGKNKKFILLIVFAALFHKSAIFLLTLVAFVSNKNKILMLLSVLFFGSVIAVLLLAQQYEALLELYYDQKLTSDGGLYRIALNILPAIIILFFSKNAKLKEQEYNLWRTLSFMSLILFPLITITPTATDRLFIYLIPIQIYCYSNINLWFKNKYTIFIFEFGIILFHFILMFVWLSFGSYREYWVPYRMFPFS